MNPCQESSLILRISDERRIKCCQFVPSAQSMLAPRSCQQHYVPRKHSVSLVETILAFVVAFGHNVVMLHCRPITCVGAVVESFFRAGESGERW